MVSVAVKVSSPNPEHNVKVETPVTYRLKALVHFSNNILGLLYISTRPNRDNFILIFNK